MSRVILHVDMDAFFAQVEQIKNPALRGKPVIVGGDARNRGVVSTCSYEARKYGIHSAMSSYQARKLCPQAIFINGSISNYVYISSQILNMMYRFTPIIEPTSIDEAFLDITHSVHLHDSPIMLAQRLKDTIRNQLQLTCSIGVAANKFLAKTASDFNKPDGLTTLWDFELQTKFFPLKVRKLYGVGPKTEAILNGLGIMTVGDLAQYPESELIKKFGKNGEILKAIANGRDDTPVFRHDEMPDEKSISHEHTLSEDTSDISFLSSLLLTLTDKVVMRMNRGEFMARTVRLRLRYQDFSTITREITLMSYTDEIGIIYQTALSLIPQEDVARKKVRLIGVGVKGLIKSERPCQSDIFEEGLKIRKEQCHKAMGKIRDKYGKFSILRASTLPFRWDH